MRICLYSETALPKVGGQEMVVDALARQFTAQGHDVVLLAAQPRPPLRPRDEELPYRVVRHPRFFSTRHLVSWYRYWLLRCFRKTPFDLLHCHSTYPCGYLAALTRDILRVPTVITSHGGDIREGNVRLQKPGLEARFRLALDRADALIAIGRITEEGFLRLGADAEKIVSIPNGVDLQAFAEQVSRPENLPPEISPGNYLLFLGRVHEQKGIDVALRALSLLPPENRPLLALAGGGEALPMLQDLARQLHLEDRVRFLGPTFGRAKTYLLQHAVALVAPSRRGEAFPLVVLEANAGGAPVIGTRIPGLQDVVRHEQTGLLVSPESPEELASAIARLWHDRPFTAALSAHALASVRDYSWSNIARRHIELFQSLPQPARRRAA